MSRTLWMWMIILLLAAAAAGVPAAASAGKQPVFQMEIVKLADRAKYQVMVTAKNLVDVYAYELNFAYDTNKLKLLGSKSGAKGFEAPIEKERELIYAFTKIGNAASLQGSATLVTLTFERAGHEETDIKLATVSLVDSKLNKIEFESNISVSTADVKQEISFTDIDGHWAESEIRSAALQRFVSGYPDGTFRPQQPVSRAEFASMLARALKLAVDSGTDTGFADNDAIPTWARSFIRAAAAMQVVHGYDDRTFRAGQTITRTEMTAMLIRALGIHPGAQAQASFSFVDAEQIPSWAQSEVAAAVDLGIMHGRGNNLFAPNENTTRAEAVTAILNLLDQ